MNPSQYLPVLELTRGQTVESIHYGAIAVVNSHGGLLASWGDPYAVTYLRSTAKPFQALPFIELGGHEFYQLTPREVALMCASHTGTDDHVNVVLGIQAKTGVTEADLLCGVHTPSDEETAEALRQRGELPTSNRHNCSGKHTGMLASARMQGYAMGDYINQEHPVQKSIVRAFAEMCSLPESEVALGIDGCSAPNFAVPLYNAALAYARLCDPEADEHMPSNRVAACRTIVAAMTTHPDMVGGPDSFDTHLMRAAPRHILSKGGAEGYQGLGLLPGALGAGSSGVGIALKISDGDARGRARHAVTLEVLRQLGALTATQLETFAAYGPTFPVRNWRKIVVGQASPCFQLSPSLLNLQGPG